MSLSKYREIRKFGKTDEPKGMNKHPSNEGELRFVVQKHEASHLHYDFRLECEGVLKSWAVPKGPSMNAQDKHLALMVEDHPLEYRKFEGVIPTGNYGAGTVMVWDEGTYFSLGSTNNKASQKLLLQGLKNGHISFILKGKKLKGEFTLVKLKGKTKNAWLLIKKKDAFAVHEDILLKTYSAMSGREMEEIKQEAEQLGQLWHSNKK